MKNELGDEIVDTAPQQTATSAGPPAGAVNELGDEIVGDDHSLKVVKGSSVPPAQAAKSMYLSAKTGVPASVVNLNPSLHEQHYNVAEGVSAGNRNPYIANYINDVPMAASVSQGDWRKLEDSSQSLQALAPMTSANQLLLNGLSGWSKGLSETARGFVEGFGSEPLGAGPAFLAEHPSWLIFQPVSVVLDAMLRVPTGIIHAVARNAALRYGQLGGSDGEKEGVYREVVNGLGFLMIEAGAIKPKAGTPINRLSTKAELDAFHGILAGLKTRAEMDAFLKGKAAEITPERLQIAQANRSSVDLSKAVAEANQTGTKAVSPTAYEQFAEIHGDLGTVHIPATTILELYQAEGKVPLKGDRLFGFIPNIAEKMLAGVESKTEIAVPMAKYVANIDEALHEKISGAVRFQPKGTTLEEAKELEAQAAPEPGKPAVGINSPAATALDLERDGKKITIAAEEAPVVLEFLHTVEMERKTLYLEPLFDKGKDVNITQPEFKQYSNLIDRANETILAKAVEVARSQIAQTMTQKWRADALKMKDTVANEIESTPVMRADRYLRTGSLEPGQWLRRVGTMVKLDKAAVEGVLGEGGLARHTVEDGADINVLAQTFGFQTGADMVRALDALSKDRVAAGLEPREYFDRAVKEETESRMQAEHGHLSDNIAVAASELALHKFNVDLLSAEWKILARLAGKDPPLARADLTAWTEEQFGKGYVSQASYETYRRAADKAGREAEKALLKKKYDEAFNAKQTQMLNFLLAKEAKGFEKEVNKNEKVLGKYAAQANLPAVDQKYTDQIHSLMLDYNLPIRRSKDNVDHNLEGKTLPVFIAEQKGQGASLVEPVLPRAGTKVEDFTVNEYRDFASLVQNLDHVGRNNKKIEIAGKKEDYEQGIGEAVKNLDSFVKEGFDPEVKGPISALRKAGRYVDSKLYKAENLIDRIDHHNPLGALNSAVNRPLIEGQAKVGFMLTKLAKMIDELPSDRAWGKALNDLTDNQELVDFYTRELLPVTNEQKVAMALNYGNKGNRDVMLRGHHFTEAEIESFLERTMSPMDWKVVNAIHDIFALLAPLVEEVTRKKSGLAVPLVQPTPFLGSKGGYYPLVQDPRNVLIKAKTQTDLFDKTKFDPLPVAPALKQRTGAVYKLDFNLSRLHSILAQTTHAVYMQEPVINANKVIKDPLVREGMVGAFGPEYVNMLDNWIRDIANNGGQNDDMVASWISRNLRENVTTMLMGYKASTALIHGGSAGFASLYEIGKMHLAEKGAKSFVLAPAELIKNIRELGLGQFLPEEARRMFSSDTKMLEVMNEVMSESLELPNRVRALQKDFGYQLSKIVNKNIIDDAAQARAIYHAYSMSMVSYLDLLTATPVWKAAKSKALMEGHENADAIYIADKAVREAHGSASLVSRANVGRGEVGKWMTVAYNGYWNHNYNKAREFANILREPSAEAPSEGPQPGMGGVGGGSETPPPRFTAGMKVALGAGFVTAMLVAPALVHHAVRGDESETTEGAILKMMLSQVGGMVPVVNSLTYGIIHNRDPHVAAVDTVLSIVKDVGVDISKLMEGKEPKSPWTHGVKAIGYLTGMGPTEQLISSTSFLNDVVNDDQSPEGIGQWMNGLMTGHAESKRHKR